MDSASHIRMRKTPYFLGIGRYAVGIWRTLPIIPKFRSLAGTEPCNLCQNHCPKSIYEQLLICPVEPNALVNPLLAANGRVCRKKATKSPVTFARFQGSNYNGIVGKRLPSTLSETHLRILLCFDSFKTYLNCFPQAVIESIENQFDRKLSTTKTSKKEICLQQLLSVGA